MTTNDEPLVSVRDLDTPLYEFGPQCRPFTLLHGRGIAGQLDAQLGADGVWAVEMADD